MIKIVLIIAFLIIFFLILGLIGQLDDICEMEKEIEILQNDLDRANSKLKESIAIRLKAINYIKEHREKQYGLNYEYNLEDKEIEDLLKILGEDKE